MNQPMLQILRLIGGYTVTPPPLGHVRSCGSHHPFGLEELEEANDVRVLPRDHLAKSRVPRSVDTTP